MNKKIQQLENLFADLLAEGADSDLLGKIWTEIQMLKHQLDQLMNAAKNE